MSKFYPAHVAHESFGAGAQKLSARTIYRIPYTASPNHVLWLHPIEQLRYLPLTRELNNFMEYVQLDNEEEQCRSHIVADLEDIVAELFPGAQVSLFGSYTGGLSTFTSDLDMTIMFPNRRHFENATQSITDASHMLDKSAMETQLVGNLTTADNQRNEIGFEQSQNEMKDESTAQTTYDREELRVQNAFKLEELYEKLKSARWVQRIEYRPRARVPIINFFHRSGVECDISMDLPLQSTLHVVRALLQRCGPALAKLSAFLKIYLNQLGLDAPFTGGLGSYKLYVLLAKRIEAQPQDMILGDRLIDFLGYYGQPQNLNEHTIVEVENAEPASFERTSKVQEIQSAFATAHRVLRDSASNAEHPGGAKKKYIGCMQASCSALAELLDTERLYQERMHRRTLCHQYIASTAVTIPSAKKAMEIVLVEGDTDNDQNPHHHMLPSSASSESLADLHEQLGTLKSRLLEKRSAGGAASRSPVSLLVQDSFSAPPLIHGLQSTPRSADPRLVFNPTDTIGKRIVAGTDPLPAHMIVAEDKKMFLPAETQQRLGPFRSLHLGEKYTQRSLEDLEMLQNQHQAHVARLKESLSQAPVPPSSLKVFSPLTEYGKLILAGELPVPPLMKITQQQRQRIEEEQHCRDGLAKLIELKQRTRSRSSSRSGSFEESEPDNLDKTSAAVPAAAVQNGTALSTRCDDTASIESFSESGVDFERCDGYAEEWKVCDVGMLGEAQESDTEETLTVGWSIDRIPTVEEPVSAVNTTVSDPPLIRHDWSPMRAPDLRLVEKYKHRGPLSPPLTPSVVATPALSVGVSPANSHTDASCGSKKQRTEQTTSLEVVVLPAPSIPASGTAPCSPTRNGLLQNDSPPIVCTVTSAQGQAEPYQPSVFSPAMEVTSSSEGSASKPSAKRPLPSAMQFEQSKPLSRMMKRADAVVLSPLVPADQCGATLKQESEFGQKKRQKIEQIDQSVLTANSLMLLAPSVPVKLGPGSATKAIVPEPCTVVTRSVTPQQEDAATTHASPVISKTASELAPAKGGVKKPVSSQAHSAASSSSTTSKITYGKTVLISIQPVQVGATTVPSPRKIAKKLSVPADMFTNIVSGKSSAGNTASNVSTTGIRMPSSKTNKQSRMVPVSSFTPPASVESHRYAVPSAPQTRVGRGSISYIPPPAPPSAPVPHPPQLLILPPQSYGNQLPTTHYTPYTTPYDSLQLQQPPAQGFVETQLYQHQLTHYQNHMLQNSQYLHHYQAPFLSPPPVIPAGSYNVGGYAMEQQYSPQVFSPPLPPPVPPQPLPPAPVLQVPQHGQHPYHASMQSASLPSYGMHQEVPPPFHQQQQQPLQQQQYYDVNNTTHTYPTTHYNTQHARDVSWTHHPGVYNHFVSESYYTPPAPPQPPAPK